MITQARVLEALATVHDPELDEPITSLGFVGSCVVGEGGDVDVHLRLPTPQCAPNFAYLMASDAREAVRRVPGVGEVGVVLDDHYTADEINAAVGGRAASARRSRARARATSRRCASCFSARRCSPARAASARCCSPTARRDHAAVVALRVADLPDHPEVARCLALRRELGLPCGPGRAGARRRRRQPV